MKEKQELLALNNQMALEIQSLKGSPLSDKSIENMMSPVDETTTSDVLFARVNFKTFVVQIVLAILSSVEKY